MRSKAETLEFTLLGLLSQSPLHGYEIRKRLSAIYGPFRALSFSVLYPQLRRMLEAGLIAERVDETTRRSRIVYTITKAGEKKFSQLTDVVNPEILEVKEVLLDSKELTLAVIPDKVVDNPDKAPPDNEATCAST